MKTINQLLGLATASLFAVATTQAQTITVEASGGGPAQTGFADTTISSVEVAGTNNMLLVGIISEGIADNTDTIISWGTDSVTHNNADYIGRNGGNRAAIFVFENLTAGINDLIVDTKEDTSGGDNYQVGFLSISATADLNVIENQIFSEDPSVDVTSNTLTFTNDVSNGLLFGVGTNNDQQTSYLQPFDTIVADSQNNTGGKWGGSVSYSNATETGQSFDWTIDSANRLGSAAILVEAVPEPSALALLSLAGFLMVLRRRRA